MACHRLLPLPRDGDVSSKLLCEAAALLRSCGASVVVDLVGPDDVDARDIGEALARLDASSVPDVTANSQLVVLDSPGAEPRVVPLPQAFSCVDTDCARTRVVELCVEELRNELLACGCGAELCDCTLRALVQAVPGQLCALEASGAALSSVVPLARKVHASHPEVFKDAEAARAGLSCAGKGFNVKRLDTPQLVAAKFDRLATNWEDLVTASGYEDVWKWLSSLTAKPLAQYCGEEVSLRAMGKHSITVLDACCGVGLPGQLIRLLGFTGRIVGCDISPGMLGKAQSRCCYDELLVEDANASLGVADESADVVVCVGSMELLDIPLALQCGYARRVPHNEAAGAKRLYEKNPVAYSCWMVFEYTNRCAMACSHCYNSSRNDIKIIQERPEILSATAEPLQMMGIEHFWFIGGEVLQFGDGWLNVCRAIASRRGCPRLGLPFGRPSAPLVEVITSGWFLGKTNISAAGKTYDTVGALLRDLKENGVTHVCYSVDAPTAELHDANRKTPGLFDRIMTLGFQAARDAGLEPRVSLLVRPEWRGDPRFIEFLAMLSSRIYGGSTGSDTMGIAGRLITDPTNLLLRFIDIGTGAKRAGSDLAPTLTLEQIASEGLARCKSYFKPGPWISLKANGNFSACRILSGEDEGYGNIHDCPGGIVELLNGLQDRFLYKLHAEGRSFLTPCAVRAIVSLIAKLMHDRGVQRNDVLEIARINREVAVMTGYSSTATNW
eukprot:m51a1_g2563 hypothetical protein (727) ;mRNA; f:343260-346382